MILHAWLLHQRLVLEGSKAQEEFFFFFQRMKQLYEGTSKKNTTKTLTLNCLGLMTEIHGLHLIQWQWSRRIRSWFTLIYTYFIFQRSWTTRDPTICPFPSWFWLREFHPSLHCKKEEKRASCLESMLWGFRKWTSLTNDDHSCHIKQDFLIRANREYGGP